MRKQERPLHAHAVVNLPSRLEADTRVNARMQDIGEVVSIQLAIQPHYHHGHLFIGGLSPLRKQELCKACREDFWARE